MAVSQSNPNVTISNPEGLHDPSWAQYSHVSVSAPGCRTICVAGQGGQTADGVIAPNFRGQVRQTLHNVRAALVAAGAGWRDVGRLQVLMVDVTPERLQIYIEEMHAELGDGLKPPNTLIPVACLAAPGFEIEIDAIAFLPA